MKGKRIAQRWMAMLTILVMVIGCLGLQTPVTDAYAATTGMSVVCGKRMIAVKCTTTIKPSVPATFKSSNAAVAVVSSNGLVTGRKAGTAKITITAKKNKKIKRIVTITVKDQLVVKSPASGKTALYAGHSTTIKTNIPAVFRSLNTAVATVDKTGKVIAKKAGTAKIKMRAKSNYKLTAIFTVTVKTPLIITAPKRGAVTLYAGDSTTIKTNIPATFKSSNTKVATVDSTGKVSAIKEGTSVVAVKAKSNPNLVRVVKITVNAPVVIVEKNADDVAALTEIVQELNSQGMNFPEDMDAECYTWTDSRITGIDWRDLDLVYNPNMKEHSLDLSRLTTLKKLDVCYNNLTGLDVSKCVELASLDCSTNNISKLDVSGLTELKYLECSSAGISELDMSDCGKIERIDLDNNHLTNLDLSNFSSLQILYCSYNNLLTSLNVSGCTALRTLYYDNIDTSDALKLDVSGCTSLELLDCSYSKTLADLDITDCKKLQCVHCSDTSIKTLDLSNCSELTELIITKGKLSSLDVSGCVSLENLCCDYTDLTSLDVSGLTNLKTLFCEGNYDTLISLNARGCKSLTTLCCGENYLLANVDIGGCTALQLLDCHYDDKISDLDVSDCTALTELDCSGAFEKLDIGKCTALTKLECRAKNLKNLDVSACKFLESIFFEGNSLTSFSVDELDRLTELKLYCEYDTDSVLSEINVSDCKALTVLVCDNHELAELNIVNCPVIKELTYAYNPISEFDIRQFPNLTKLALYACENLKELDLHDTTNLITLNCYGSALTKLNVSGCSSLTEIDSRDCYELADLNLGGCTSLQSLDCRSNALTELDVSSCSSLKELRCGMNKLTGIDVGNLTKLESLDCIYNKITYLDLSNCTALKELNCDSDVAVNGYTAPGETDL